MTAPTSGWGIPSNKIPGAKIHWYNTTDLPICDTEHLGFAGTRLPSKDISVTSACPVCLALLNVVFGDLDNISVAT